MTCSLLQHNMILCVINMARILYKDRWTWIWFGKSDFIMRGINTAKENYNNTVWPPDTVQQYKQTLWIEKEQNTTVLIDVAIKWWQDTKEEIQESHEIQRNRKRNQWDCGKMKTVMKARSVVTPNLGRYTNIESRKSLNIRTAQLVF